VKYISVGLWVVMQHELVDSNILEEHTASIFSAENGVSTLKTCVNIFTLLRISNVTY
jgi:hypothetical protein